MNKIRLLIVDDDEDNRLVLRAICRSLDGFEIKEAVDGLEAVEMAEEWEPHIILMDIMMPRMDGLEASRIIKERAPKTVIIGVTGITDSRMEEKMMAIGIDIYIHKPIDRELIRFKLQSVESSIRLKEGNFKDRSKKIILNPFNSDIPSYKTIFDIVDTEAMMEFGMWLFDHYSGKTLSSKFDKVIEVFYKIMKQGNENDEAMTIIVEESYEEFYITIKCNKEVDLEQNLLNMLNDFGSEIIVEKNIVCARLSKPIDINIKESVLTDIKNRKIEKLEDIEKADETKKIEKADETEKTNEKIKEIRVISSDERELLHQSFIHKTSAQDYIEEIGGDILEEILDLSSIDEEWVAKLDEIEKSPTEENFIAFTDNVLSVYVATINNLFEFTALAYALTSLGMFIKDNTKAICEDSSKVKKMAMLLEYLGKDLSTWREHIFVLQDTADIHYLDSSFFSSCMQIEGIISEKDVSNDEDNDMEFF